MSVLPGSRRAPAASPGRLRRWVARVAVVSTAAAGTSVALAGAALAWHPDITGTVDCDGTAHVTATAWNSTDPSQRVNPSIGIGYAVNSSTVTSWTAANGAFAAPTYSFSTTFKISPSLKPGDVITFSAKALGTWSDGTTGQTTPAPLPTYTIPASCASTNNGNGGSNGTVKINGQYGVDDINDSNIANQPHVQCPFTLKFYDFDPGTNTADVTFTSQAPSSPATGDQNLPANTGRTHFAFAGGGPGGTLNHTELYRLDTTGLIEQPEQGYHVKVTTVVTSAKGQITFSKSKVYWIAPCPGNPDVNIDKSGPATGTLHQTGTYTLTVANAAGADTVTDDPITVTDTLPAGESFVSASGDGWTSSVSGQVITFTHANSTGLAGGASLPVITVVVRYTATGDLTDTARVLQVTDETHTSDNTDSVTTTVTPPVQTLAAAIYDCTTGTASTTPVSGGHIDAAGPQVISVDNPLTATNVAAGDYTVTATAPAGYHFVTTCGNLTATNPQPVNVPEGGSGSASFYVAHDTGDILGVIIDCGTGSPVTGGSWSATGPQAASGANGETVAGVLTGIYSMTATAPADFHFVPTCGPDSGPNPQDVEVPANGLGTGTFYVVHDTGAIVGVIVDCTSGTPVTGGSWSATGPGGATANGGNGIPQADVTTGIWSMTATAPATYHLVSCDHGDAFTKSVDVPANGTGTGTFYVARDTGAIEGIIVDCASGTPVTGGSWSATGPQDAAGANGETVNGVLTGLYTMTATAPADYHLVSCGQSSADTRSVTVDTDKTGIGTFYVAHDTGAIEGVILDCSTGSPVTGGGWSASGPQDAAGANGETVDGVLTGLYTMTATAPADYHLVLCGQASADTKSVFVPANDTGVGTFYVAHDTGDITGVIVDCTGGTDNGPVSGGSWSATGPQDAAGANGETVSGVLTGRYSMTATAPAGYHLVAGCGGATGPNPQDVVVPVDGLGTGTFYVAHDTGAIVGVIVDCTGGTANGPVAGGTWSATGPQTVTGANGETVDGVLTGPYSMTATAPAGFHVVTGCGDATGPNPQDVIVPANGTGTGTFFVAHDTGAIVGVIVDCTGGTANGPVTGGSWSATGPQPVTGANGETVNDVLTGPYSMTATAPAGYHVVTGCGDATGPNPQDVIVPANGTGTGTFYVAHDTGAIEGLVVDCGSGSAGDQVAGATWTATGPQPAGGATGETVSDVLTGPYSMTASLPAGWHFVDTCGAATGTNPQDVLVPANGTGVGTFYAVRNPDLGVVKGGPATGTQNLTGVYTITVSAAAGTSAVPGPVVVTDTLPAGEQYVSFTGDGWTAEVNGQVVTFTHQGDLASGASEPVISVTVLYTAQGDLTDTAHITPPPGDTNPDNDTSTVTTTVGPPPAITLGVVKQNDANNDGAFSDSETATTLGETVTYQVTATNTSSVPVVVTSVLDAAPVGSTPAAVICLADGANVVGTVLAPGEAVTCTFTGTAPSTDSSSLTDEVTVLGEQQGFPDNTGQGQDTSTVLTATPTPGQPDLSIVKTASATKVKTGDTLTYTLAVTNVGEAATSDATTVTDSVPAGLRLDSVTAAAPWACGTAGQVVTCTDADPIAAGAALPPIVITTTVLPAAVGTLTNTGVVSNPGDHNPTNDTSTVKTPVTQVLGTKTVKPPSSPSTPSVTPTVLPFTGSNTGSALLLALELLVAGAALTLMARRRSSKIVALT